MSNIFFEVVVPHPTILRTFLALCSGVTSSIDQGTTCGARRTSCQLFCRQGQEAFPCPLGEVFTCILPKLPLPNTATHHC